MKDEKFARQLSDKLQGIKKMKSFAQAADNVHLAKSSLSNIKSGRKGTSKEVRESIVKRLWSLKMALSSGRADYGIPSFLNDKNIRLNPYVTAYTQRKEEQERRNAEISYLQAISKIPEKRTSEDLQAIDTYFKEYLEEIGSEETDFDVKAKDAGLTDQEVQDIVSEYNDQLGG
ncbi:MAG: hypothetical protein SOH70_04055 [Lentilactobacillus sunkii]|uniref:hypothetical protein n=1 Tax=Lentilactobacillus sunkii TaxID=481719 RepID=UPI002F34FA08